MPRNSTREKSDRSEDTDCENDNRSARSGSRRGGAQERDDEGRFTSEDDRNDDYEDDESHPSHSHRKAAESYRRASQHHEDAAHHSRAGNHHKAAHSAMQAHAHSNQGKRHAGRAAEAHNPTPFPIVSHFPSATPWTGVESPPTPG